MKKFILVSILIAFFSCNNVDIPKPNVIIIYADDLGYGDVSSYGLGTLQTPNIDKIANNGIKFTNITPTKAVTRCPKKTFRGCAKGLSGKPNNKTIDDPNEAAKNKPNILLYVRTVNIPIVNAEKIPAIKAFLKTSFLNSII